MFWKRKRDKETDNSRTAPASFTGLILDSLTAKGEGPSDYNAQGLAMIHMLAIQGSVDAMRPVLEHGYDPNLPARAEDVKGYTPLHFAALNGHVDQIDLLIEYGADVNRTSVEFNTPLHLAAYVGKAAAIRALLAHGADTTLCDDVGKTAYNYAVEQGHMELAGILSRSGNPKL
jgi:ankyrin repeat protein